MRLTAVSAINERMSANAEEPDAVQKLLAARKTIVNLATGGALDRINQRAGRGQALRPWGISMHGPLAGSPLAEADAAFLSAYPHPYLSNMPVTGEALYPAANATENLSAVAVLVKEQENGQLYAGEVMQLCRSAMDSAARAIWLLCDPSAEERASRGLTLVVNGLDEQAKFLGKQAAVLRSGTTIAPPEKFAQLADHSGKVDKALAHIKDTYTPTNFKGPLKTVTRAAAWIDGHRPAHDTGELAAGALLPNADSFYSMGSSPTHGLSWATDYASGGGIFRMMSDGLFCALIMTECAVALFETLSRDPADASTPHEKARVPSNLEPTVQAWAQMFNTP